MALRDLIVSLSANTSSLQDMNRHMNTLSGNTSGASKEMSNLESRTGKTAKILKGAAIGVAAVGTAAVGAGAGIFAMASKTAETTDRIDKLSQKIGLSRQGFQEWEFIMSQSGGSVEGLQMGFKTLVNSVDQAVAGTGKGANSFKALGIAVKDSKGNVKDQETIFNEAVVALQKMEEGTEKAKLANDLFGRSGAEMMPLLNGAAGSVEEMRKKANDLGLVLGDDAVDAGVVFTDTMDQTQRSMSAMGALIGSKVMPIVQKMLDFVLDNMPTITRVMSLVFNSISSGVSVAVGWFQKLMSILSEWRSSNESTMIGIWQTIQTTFGQVVSFLQKSWATIQSFWEEKGQSILQNAINIFGSIRDTVTTVFTAAWMIIQTVLSMAVPFIQEKLALIQKFWTENGSQIMEAVQNSFKFIQSVIQFVMPLVLGIIKMVWKNIEGVISGALNVIMGLVKVFSGLFTGDFSKMWEGLKQVFFGAVQFIWNFISLTFFGKILGGAKAFILLFRGSFAAMWTGLKTLFSTSVGTIFTKVTGTFNTLRTTTATIFGKIVSGIKTKFDDIVGAAKNLPKRIGDGIGAMASKVNAGVTKVINKLAETLGKGINGVIGGINTVLGWIGVDGGALISTWPVPQWANGTGNGSHPGGPALINDGKGSNAGRELIRTPDGKMGMFNGKNVIANLPKGTQVLSATDTRGVLNSMPQYNSGTEDNSGIFGTMKNIASDLYSGAKNIGGKVVDAAFNVFDYIKNPNKLLSLAMDKLGISSPEGGNFIGDMAKGAFNKVKGSAIDFVKKKLDAFSAAQSSGIALTGGNGGGFGAPFRLTSRPGPRNTGIPGASRMHKGWDWAAPVGTPIPSVSNGIVTRNSWHPLSGKFVEISSGGLIHRYQHNSRNAVKVGQQVIKGQTVGYVGSTGVSSGPHLHYEVKKGFAKGTNGPLKKATTAWVGERGPELMHLNKGTEIFSHNDSKRMEGRGYSTNAVSSSGGAVFAPQIKVEVQGNADRDTANLIADKVSQKVEEIFSSMNRRYSFDREG